LDARRNNDAQAFALSSIFIAVGTSRWPKKRRALWLHGHHSAQHAGNCMRIAELDYRPLHLMDEPSLYGGIDPGHRPLITMRARRMVREWRPQRTEVSASSTFKGTTAVRTAS